MKIHMRINKVLIVYAHPNTESHCQHILKQVKKQLTLKKSSFEIVDLYKLKYDPVLHENEHYTTKGNRFVSKQNKLFQQKITNSDLLIFIYPVWWGSMPAVLKGFFDRVFVSGFAFKYVNGLPLGLLKDKKAIVFMTSGSPKIISSIIMHNRYVNIIKKDILGFCGLNTSVYQIGNALRLDQKKVDHIEKIVRNVFKNY